jgi:hypothetical protein
LHERLISGIVYSMTPAGRPEIGQPINIRLPEELLARVDALATEESVSRAEEIRRLLTAMLDQLGVAP